MSVQWRGDAVQADAYDTIRRQLDKFHDFQNSFAFYTIKKSLPRKLAALPREHVDRNFETVPGFSLNLH